MTNYEIILQTRGAGKAAYRFFVEAPYSCDALIKARALADANGFTAYNLGLAHPVNPAAGVNANDDFWVARA